MKKKTTVAVVGARGYAGLELIRLLKTHPEVDLTHAYATRAFDLRDDLPGLTGVACQTEDELFTHPTEVVFLATPADVSARLAPELLRRGQRVIDLSGAFRLRRFDMKAWYGFNTDLPADYGLNPFCGPLPAGTKLIANPGCYATAISLALIPLVKAGVIEPDGLVVDAKSGTTGAGRKAGENLLFAEVDGECLPYRVGRHQHLPEIREAALTFAGRDLDMHFVTHLLPVKRGITAAVFAKARTRSLSDVAQAFGAAYDAYPLVRHGEKVLTLARLSSVVGSPYTHISYTLTENKLYVFSVLDNLMKGAASQAVENLNRMLDLPAGFALHEEA